MPDTELVKLTISELAPMIRARKVSPVEVVEASLAQVDRLQPALNSFITILYDQARSRARDLEAALTRGEYFGPLHGIPVGIKDNIATGGIRSTAGSKLMADYIPEEDAHAVSLCKQAGAIILGKESLFEFASGGTPVNPHYGTIHNPWALDHSPGGSSSGGGANVAACITFASLGTDMGGSVRLPAAYCGVVGLKQTFGRVSQRGLLATGFNGDHIGPLTRSARDSALVLQAIAGHDPLDPTAVPVPVPDYLAGLENSLRGLKMGIPTSYYFEQLEPEVEAGIRRAIAALEELGVEARDVAIPSLRYAGAWRIPHLSDMVVSHDPYIEGNHQDYGPNVLALVLAGQFYLGRDYSKGTRAQRTLREEFARVLDEVDFLVTPTSPIAAPPIVATTVELGGSESRVSGVGSASTVARNTLPSNFTGLPAITVPCGFTQAGLPIGLQIMGRPFDESLLFRVANGYEAVSPSLGHRPGIIGEK